jgi:hypothetical protein
MKRPKQGTASVKARSSRGAAVKKSAPRKVRTQPSRPAVAARAKSDQEGLVAALTDLVEIAVEIRDLLAQIRDALVEGEETESGEVDTVVIAEAEPREPSEDEV